MNDELLTMRETAQLLRVSRATVNRWTALDLIPKPIKIMGKLLFRKSELMQALDKNSLAS